MSESLLAIEWTDPESKGFVDLFPQTLFSSDDKSRIGVEHPVVGRRGGFYRAKCSILVKGKYAYLDYGEFPDENNRWEMCLGVTRIIFSSLKRDEIKSIQWKDEGKRTFQSNVAKPVSNPLGKSGAYKLGVTNKQRAKRDIVERTGQARFKADLMAAYGDKCCISGCSVKQALDGAHIDMYNGKSSNHTQNGILLRRDIHALFDSNLIGIEPKTKRVHLSKAIKNSRDYRGLHGRKIKTPYIKYCCPSIEALQRRWKEFNK